MVIDRVARPAQVRREVKLHTETGVLVTDRVARALRQTLRSDGDPVLLAMASGAPFTPGRVDLTGIDGAAEPARMAALRSWLHEACARHRSDRTTGDTGTPFSGGGAHVW